MNDKLCIITSPHGSDHKEGCFWNIILCSPLKDSRHVGETELYFPLAFTLVCCSAYFTNLKMEAICFFETSMDSQWLHGVISQKMLFFECENTFNLLILSPIISFFLGGVTSNVAISCYKR
jgi:hypothetical protein